MKTCLPEPVCLVRRDPARNMARFYVLSLSTTLFGEIALTRNWGRIGARGQVMTETFGEASAAEAASLRLEAIKTRRGYRPVARKVSARF